MECFGNCTLPRGTVHAYFDSVAAANEWTAAHRVGPSGRRGAVVPQDERFEPGAYRPLTLTAEEEGLLSVEAFFDHKMRQLVPNAAYLYYSPPVDGRGARVRFDTIKDEHIQTFTDVSKIKHFDGFMLYNKGAGITEDGVECFELMTSDEILDVLEQARERLEFMEQINSQK